MNKTAKILFGFAAGIAVVLLTGAVATVTSQYGAFVGDGSGLTNVSLGTTLTNVPLTALQSPSVPAIATNVLKGNAANLTNMPLASFQTPAVAAIVTNIMKGNGANLTNIPPAAISSPAVAAFLTNLFQGNGVDLTNVTASSTNAMWSQYATNDSYGKAIVVDNTLTKTNPSAVTSMAISGVTGDGIRLAVRKAADQGSNVFEVQTEANVMMFGVRSNGVLEGNGLALTNIPSTAMVDRLQPATAALTNLSALTAITITNGGGCTVTAFTNATTGQLYWSITVP